MKIEPLPPPSPSLESEVHRRLREMILAGELAPGALYSMNELATQLGVSRTPVAQAVTRLVDEGMIRVEHRRGMRVLETSGHALVEIYQIRLLLEPPATHRATTLMRRADHHQLERALHALAEVAEGPRQPARVPAPRRALSPRDPAGVGQLATTYRLLVAQETGETSGHFASWSELGGH